MRGAALVGDNGSIDWLCLPRFDSDAVCCALLGGKENGFWQIAPAGEVKETRQRYRGQTLILETEFISSEGRVLLTDCLPVGGSHEVLRIVDGLEGNVSMNALVSLRTDYGRCSPWLRKRSDGNIVSVAGPDSWLLRSSCALEICERNIIGLFATSPGSRHTFSLVWTPSHEHGA